MDKTLKIILIIICSPILVFSFLAFLWLWALALIYSAFSGEPADNYL